MWLFIKWVAIGCGFGAWALVTGLSHAPEWILWTGGGALVLVFVFLDSMGDNVVTELKAIKSELEFIRRKLDK